MVWLPGEPATERFLFALHRLRMGGLAWVTRQPCALDVMFALRVADRLGLPGSGRGLVDRAQALLTQAQSARLRVLEQGLALATSTLSPGEFGQAVEALQQQAAGQLAPFDARFAGLLDEVAWPERYASDLGSSRRLASPWLAHGLMMAMAAGCAGSGARPPVADAAPDAPHIYISFDVPIGTSRDTQPVEARSVEAQSLTHECPSDGGQTAALDASCNLGTLETAVQRAAHWPCTPSDFGGDYRYAVVIDCEGRAVELLSLPDQTPFLEGAERQAWLDALANERWTCYAGQSVHFTCMICLFP
jgi:hypothetical protein